MKSDFWDEAWWSARPEVELEAWRGVEAQHIVATMRLVADAQEQAILEDLLEQSKPALNDAERRHHYLAFTPFRYRSPVASRFRAAHEPGVWYGAESIETACTELAYWGHQFLLDSEGLRDEVLITEFTVFPAVVAGASIDLASAPWNANAAHWAANDYTACHALAAEARERQIHIIRYWSARHVEGRCCAVLDVEAIAEVDTSRQQTWHRRVTREAAFMVHSATGRSISLQLPGD